MELECSFNDYHSDAFEVALHRLHPDMDLGTDGSVEQDSRFKFKSILDEDDFMHEGREIRTPALPIDEGLKLFEKTILLMNKWTQVGHLFTNASCGLHINISEETMAARFDRFCRFYSHLVTIFPERKVLTMFGRVGNEFCHPLFTERGQGQANWLTIQALAMAGKFGTNKYHSIGLHNGRKDDYPVENRRIEFRCLGGKDYHIKGSKLGEALGLIVSTATDAYEMTLASTEAVEGKVRKLIDDGVDLPRYATCSN